MNRNATLSGLIFAVLLAGCASLSIDPRMTGTFTAANSETLTFTSDGRVFHAQPADGTVARVFLGYYTSRSSEPRCLGFVGPDTSPFLGTSFQVSDDFSSVTASWDNLRKPGDQWQVIYRKTGATN